MHRRTFLRAASAAGLLPFLPSPLPAFARVGRSDTRTLDAIRGDGSPVTLPAAAVSELAASLRGPMLLSDHPAYDIARRVWNPGIDRRPALIVQPTGAADVRRAVSFAAAHDLLLAVKCGGHSFSGMSTCDRGMLIDLSLMRGVQVDVARKRAVVEGGTLLGQVDHETAAFGLVTPLGTVSHTGVGGLTTGGGFGRLARKYGLAVDNVTGVQVVTADGQLRQADASSNPDLYWAVRGGGGNFGIVTSFEFQLHERRPDVVGGSLVFPIAKARDVLRFYADYTPQAPDDLYLDFVMVAPPGGADGVCQLHVCYAGDNPDRDLAPIRKVGTPVRDTLRALPYTALQKSNDQTDQRVATTYMKSGFTPEIGKPLIDALLTGFRAHPARATAVFTQQAGGAIARPAVTACAFPHRYAQHSLMHAVTWNVADDGAPHLAYARSYWATLEPLTRGFYVNEVNDESREVLNANYRENYPRLAGIKKQLDPTNLFRLNANIQPA